MINLKHVNETTKKKLIGLSISKKNTSDWDNFFFLIVQKYKQKCVYMHSQMLIIVLPH